VSASRSSTTDRAGPTRLVLLSSTVTTSQHLCCAFRLRENPFCLNHCMEGSVTVHMAAPATKIWELVADVRNIGRFSPETFAA